MPANTNASSCDCVDSWVVETVLEGILLPGIGTLGILGNILVLVVFRKSYIKTSTFFLLLAILAVVDLLCILDLVVEQSLVQVWEVMDKDKGIQDLYTRYTCRKVNTNGLFVLSEMKDCTITSFSR